MTPLDLPDLLAPTRRQDPSRPLVTFYDDATGERVELSAVTFGNWVAKTANLLADLDVEAGDDVGILLPTHWQTAAVLAAVWTHGAAAWVGRTAIMAAGQVPVLFADVARLDQAIALRDGEHCQDLVVLPLKPLGGRLDDGQAASADGVHDYAATVLAMPDVYQVVDLPAPDQRVLAIDDVEVSAADLVGLAVERAEAMGLSTMDRVLFTGSYAELAGLLDGLLVPLAGNASLVLVRNPDPAALPARAEAEMVTATVGIDIPGFRRLA
ncbi:MAG: TIGR03089 family protein [Mycobacteriales bacterium]